MPFIALDIGSSFVKGAVFDLATLQMRPAVRRPSPAPLAGRPAGYREYDPAAVLAATRAVLADLLAETQRCEGILMCGQQQCLVLCGADGEARSPVISWQDQRVGMPHPSGAGSYFDVLAGQLAPREWQQIGNELRPGHPLSLLFHMRESTGLPAPDLFLVSLPDFVAANLCGCAPTTELTLAMGHGALNLETSDWHWTLLDRLGLAGLRWPRLLPAGEIIGTYQFGAQRIPCYTPVGDYQAALVGALLRDDELSLNISTGSQVSLLLPSLAFGAHQTRPFFDGRYLATITHIPAGRSLSALVRLLTEIPSALGWRADDPWAYIAEQSVLARPGRLQADLAFFDSSCGDAGAITGIREDELTVGCLFRAAFANMAGNYLASAARLSPERRWRSLVLSGGLPHKLPALLEELRARFPEPYRFAPSEEDTLFGLTVLALAWSGQASTVAVAMSEVGTRLGALPLRS